MKSITEDNLVLILTFDSNYFKSIFPHFITTVFITNIEERSLTKRDILCDQIFSIVSEVYDYSPGRTARINNAAVALINTLMKNFRGFVIDPSERTFIHKTSHDYMQVDRISRIIQFVYENYPYKISLTDIAEQEHMSSYYLSHVFRKLVGMNFRDFVSMVRIEMSQGSILATNKSISQISQDMGFSDAKYYVAHFYNYMGCHPKEYRKKYANSVFGRQDPIVEEYTFEKLKDIVGKYTQYPVFKKDIAKVNHIEVDFQATTKCTFRIPMESAAIFKELYEDFSMRATATYDMSRLYHDILPQETAIDLLRNITSSPDKYKYPKITFTDSTSSIHGLLTPNGLKKPLYYLMDMLNQLPENVSAIDSNYIALQNGTTKYLLVFNPEKSENLTVDIIARNVSRNYKVVKYKMIAANSCLNFWAQLNFSDQLTSEDIHNINYMSKPDIEFEIIPALEQYYTAVEMAPYDIVLLKFVPH